MVIDHTQTDDILNDHFSSVFTEEILTNLPELDKIFQGALEEGLSHNDISRNVVTEKSEKLKAGKTPGTDNLYLTVLKETSVEVGLPLSILFKHSLESAELPEVWKTPNVSPLHKKGSRSLRLNYRPVSLTSQISRRWN